MTDEHNRCKQVEINHFTDSMVVKYMLEHERVLQKDLSEKLNKLYGKNTKPNNLSTKLRVQHLRFKELKDICDILGYKLLLQKRKD